MNINFSDLMQINKHTDLEKRIEIFKCFISEELLKSSDYVKIANAILEDSLSLKKKLEKRKIYPIEYYIRARNIGITYAEKNLINGRDYDYKERAAGEHNEDRTTINILVARSQNIAYLFAQIYKDYFTDVNVEELFKMMPSGMKLYDGSKKYIALYWQFISPPYDIRLNEARTIVFDYVEKDFSELGKEEVNWQKSVVNEQLDILDKFYNKYINIKI